MRLATDTMSFDRDARSRVSKKLAMQNTGDAGVKFAFDAKAAEPNFSIKPVRVRPGQSGRATGGLVHPRGVARTLALINQVPDWQQGRWVRRAVGPDADRSVRPSGGAGGQVEFKTTVRQTAEGAVSVTNGSNPWNLRPAVTGDQWSGPGSRGQARRHGGVHADVQAAVHGHGGGASRRFRALRAAGRLLPPSRAAGRRGGARFDGLGGG